MISELPPSAPGLYWLLAYSLAAISYSLAGPPVDHRRRRWLICLLILAVNIWIQIVTDKGYALWYIPGLFLAILCAYAMLAVSSGYPRNECIFLTMNAFLLGEFTGGLFWQFVLYLDSCFPGMRGRRVELTCFAVTAVVVYGTAYLVEKRFSSRDILPQFTRKSLLAVFFMTLSVFLFSNISNVFQNTPFSGHSSFQMNLIRMLVDAGGLILLGFWRMSRISLALETETEKLRSLMDAQYASYKLSEQSMELIHQKYHDLKHQIAWLREESRDEEKKSYLDNMEAEIRSFEAIADTGNHVMDTIVAVKTLQCQQKNIRLTVNADGRLLDFMSAQDLSTLLGNLLDNAIESTDKVTDPGQRWIEVSLTKKKGFVCLETGNHYTGAISFKDGVPVTTKGDVRYHGYGTRSIRMIAEAYEGTARFTAEDGWFRTMILFSREDV